TPGAPRTTHEAAGVKGSHESCWGPRCTAPPLPAPPPPPPPPPPPLLPPLPPLPL
ncbi:unnamed protein product, partial [Closterium sp. NIES-54]